MTDWVLNEVSLRPSEGANNEHHQFYHVTRINIIVIIIICLIAQRDSLWFIRVWTGIGKSTSVYLLQEILDCYSCT